MTQFIRIDSFESWRSQARFLLASDTLPAEVHWLFESRNARSETVQEQDASVPSIEPSARQRQPTLFDGQPGPASAVPNDSRQLSVPRAFLELAREVSCHRDADRWELLYRAVWRLTHGEKHLLQLTTDDDVTRMLRMQKSVRRDVHKTKAFVRFREVADENGYSTMVAWHRPDHRILRLAAPFFARRFGGMRWAILTPWESVSWDMSELRYGDGVPITDAPAEDALEDLWRTYYGSIFNPARVNLEAMAREMPVRHWPTLPETRLIPDLLQQAPTRVQEMMSRREGFDQTASEYLPEVTEVAALAEAAERCRACDLHREATQVVFGEGPPDADLVLVGEQPGDHEDQQGHPFVGPAGEVLNEALQQAGIDRQRVYLTNVVKHFKFSRRGKRRIHQKPDSREIFACRPWLEAELTSIEPRTVVCLGATAAQALIGRDFRITKQRGTIQQTDWCQRTIATWHPSALLRMPDPQRRQQMTEQLVSDLSLAL